MLEIEPPPQGTGLGLSTVNRHWLGMRSMTENAESETPLRGVCGLGAPRGPPPTLRDVPCSAWLRRKGWAVLWRPPSLASSPLLPWL